MSDTAMQNILDRAIYEKYFDGFTIYDCSIHTKDIWFFVLVEEAESRDVLPTTRFLTIGAHLPVDKRFAGYAHGDFSFTTAACHFDPVSFTQREFIAVDTRGNVYSANSSQKGVEKSIHQLVDTRSPRGGRIVFPKVVRVAGSVYALGKYRKVYRRIGFEQWVELGAEGKGVPLPKDVAQVDSYMLRLGFRDMSAFDANDMYAVGGEGDVWRFDGKKWIQSPFPTNQDLRTVCCAGDGHVYISEMNGTVWAGRESKWKKVAEADIAPGYQPVDSAWFNNRLYLGAQEGLWTIDEKKNAVVPLGDVESDAPNSMVGGRLDVSPDGKYLLTAGPHGACLNDGTGWTRLFGSFDFL